MTERPFADTPLTVCVVSHTHWDREWYHGAARFRQRLVALVDAVLAHPAPGPFLLDGQAIVLRDYLAVRPEATDAMRAALHEGRLEAGPWFVLADTLIPSGEVLVRNLAAGRRVLRALGADAPPVAWCPDTFGHPAALPTIAHGFGLDVAVVWRGLGGAGHPVADAVWWEAPDGTRVATAHLPADGYEVGSALPVDRDAARLRWERLAAHWRARHTTGVVLLPNGADHHARQPDVTDAVAALREVAGASHTVEHMPLATWAARLRARMTPDVPVVRGELRDSYGYTWTLGGALATRAAQKRRNACLERGLLRDVEPWLALVRLHDRSRTAHAVSPYGALTMAQLPTLLHVAWETLLETHPHDTLCGCSIDEVARRMDGAHDAVASQARGLREAALQAALGHDAVAARSRAPRATTHVVLRNRTARPRGGLAHLCLHETLGDVPVGPGSAHAAPIPRAGATPPSLGTWPVQWLGPARERDVRRESPQHYPDNDRVAEWRALAWVPPVPACGLLAVDAAAQDAGDAAPPPLPPPARGIEVVPKATRSTRARSAPPTQRVQLDNGIVQLEVDAGAGRIDVRVGTRAIVDALAIVTRDDDGDTYTPAPRGTPERLSLVRARLLHAGPLRATVRAVWRTTAATASRGTVRVTTDLSLDIASPLVVVHVRGVNTRRQHRLQLVMRTDVPVGRVEADAAFGPVSRPPIVAADGAQEAVPPGQPMHRWLTRHDVNRGATLIADGLAEAESRDEAEGGTLALTLLRATGALSRADLPERPGHAGWPSPTPGAQSLGVFRARCALWLHGPLDDAVRSVRRDLVDDVLLPLVGETWRDLDLGDGEPQDTGHARRRRVAGPVLEGPAFEMSAVTVSETDASAVVLRAVNLTAHRAAGSWRLPDDGPWSVTACRLDETPLGESVLSAARVPFVAEPRGVVTLLVRRVEPSAAR
ncbi:MAG: hypothetical protein LCH84_12770 [Gemmatimonadetes bacterium]|nr:hypothetical protein [Gemmatimonadota bacterium]